MLDEAGRAPAPPSFRRALMGDSLALVGEIKRRSPSAGDIRPDLDPSAHAQAYAQAGAHAISVLTNEPFFGGSLADLARVAASVRIPVLRKEFILDEVQILEARAAGAAAVLLIARVLEPGQLTHLLQFAADWGLDALVEVHTEDELTMALRCGSRILGVNSRDLDTFAIDMPRAWALLRTIPPHLIALAESGMAGLADVELAAQAGADGVLVGTALSSVTDPAPLVRAITTVRRRGR